MTSNKLSYSKKSLTILCFYSRVKLHRLQDKLDEESANKSCPLLYIDQLIEHEFGGNRIHEYVYLSFNFFFLYVLLSNKAYFNFKHLNTYKKICVCLFLSLTTLGRNVYITGCCSCWFDLCS